MYFYSFIYFVMKFIDFMLIFFAFGAMLNDNDNFYYTDEFIDPSTKGLIFSSFLLYSPKYR